MKVVAKALVIDGTGNVLVIYRGLTHPHFPGHSDLPGGEVEENEAWNVAVAREIAEETGMVVQAMQLEQIFEIKHHDVIHVLYRANIDAKKPEIILSWEHSDYQWLPLDDLKNHPLPEKVDRYYADVIGYIAVHRIRSHVGAA